MAATDQNYRQQRTLDVIFGVSCVLMLAGIIWMFVQDYDRDWKGEQETFRDVEEAIAQRQMLELVPSDQKTFEERRKQIKDAEDVLAKARQRRDDLANKVNINKLLVDKTNHESRAKALKADFDSKTSLYDIAVEKRDAATTPDLQKSLAAEADAVQAEVDELKKKLDAAQDLVDKDTEAIQAAKTQVHDADEQVAEAEKTLKAQAADFDRFAKLVVQKKWGAGDIFRALPVIDAFSSPTRIQQYTLNELPIDYNFKHVTRFDRCTTCHLGIDRPALTKAALASLKQPDKDLDQRLNNARTLLKDRQDTLKDAQGNLVNDMPQKVKQVPLHSSQVNEFCAHPRLDLFVAEASPHPAEKFGCTICHDGQGSATDFQLADHTPNNALQEQHWKASHGWAPDHDWEYPMLPKRFVESGCIKCHHQVTDLLPQREVTEYRESETGKRNLVPAPGTKVVRGYNLVRESGCFGCHEIAGVKNGRQVGPDLRLELFPPLEERSPEERAKLTADLTNLPGSMRKIGPSLRRLSEKTNEDWVVKWIYQPRNFRPNTKMPHFYNLSNNNAEALQGTGQEAFPQTEIHSMAFYLFRRSKGYLDDLKEYNLLRTKPSRTDEERQRRDSLAPEFLGQSLQELSPLPAGLRGDAAHGRQLFSERGCLACHSHNGTHEPGLGLPAVHSEAHFGPDLSRLAAKLGTTPGDRDSARRWLVQWIKDPKVHSPRTLMPVTHLEEAEAADIAAWLLDQQVADWMPPDVPAPDGKDLEALARVYLSKSMTPREVKDLFDKGLDAARLHRILDPDDQKLAERLNLDAADQLKVYIGKKAINQLGCFACHDIPGFENAKPIGTPLNDWGKKDPERLAFEDVTAYVNKTYHFVDSPIDARGRGVAPEDGKPAYERYFLEALERHTRPGFLNQKLRAPRSYDYARRRPWDERLRMPQFKFARGPITPTADETPEQTDARAEAEAREAVMTFILGLVAEPVPLKYLNEPSPDKRAIAQGVKVLDKFNCAGCHLLRSGTYEFFDVHQPRLLPGEPEDQGPRSLLSRLEDRYKTITSDENYQADYPTQFKPHNAWQGRPSKHPDRLTAHAILRPDDKEDEPLIKLRLTEALRFTKKAQDVRNPGDSSELPEGAYDIPAAELLDFPRDQRLFQADKFGGTFADLLDPYLQQRNSDVFKSSASARASLPPPLLREGEKVEPAWLFRFLRNPTKLRPLAVLRMPRFSLSDEEATTLVNYFAALDQTENPGVPLTFPYLDIRQQREDFLSEHSQQYAHRLTPQELENRKKSFHQAPRPGEPSIWDWLLKDKVEALEKELPAAKAALDSAQGTEKERARQHYEQLQQDLKTLKDKKDDKAQENLLLGHWQKDEIYATDAFRLLTNKDACLKCHQVGSLVELPLVGPRLDEASQRLRPAWTRLWIANPQRLLVYPSGLNPMPQVFSANKQEYGNFFVGLAPARLEEAQRNLKDAEAKLAALRQQNADRAQLAQAEQQRDAAKDVVAQWPLNQVTAIRDILMIYPKVAELPENRYYRPLAQDGGKP